MSDASAGAKPEAATPPREDGSSRLLIVAAHEIVGDRLVEALGDRIREPRTVARIVAPALASSPLKHVAGDVDEGIAEAEERLRQSTRRLSDDGIELSGSIGDADPLLAIEDALAEFPADEIVVVTGADGVHWLEPDLFDRARQRFRQPVVHVELEDQPHGGAKVTEFERAAGGAEPPEREVHGYSSNTPPLSIRDTAGIVIALVGTIVLVVLAADCTGDSISSWSGDLGCVTRYILAGGMALINIAHIVALVLFESVRYRGFWERFFSTFSLVGTPLAVVISLLVG